MPERAGLGVVLLQVLRAEVGEELLLLIVLALVRIVRWICSLASSTERWLTPTVPRRQTTSHAAPFATGSATISPS